MVRRILLSVLTACALISSTAAALGAELAAYVGTYTDGGGSKGIYRFTFDPATGKATEPIVAAELANPSFLAISPSGKNLYAVGELYRVVAGKPAGGTVTAFAIKEADGSLTKLNEQPSAGAGPCFVTIDRTGKNALVANYGSGSAAVLPIGADGELAPPSSVMQHAGKGTNPQRQEGPHAHSINLDAANKFAIVPDLGLDRLFVYRFDADAHTLTPNQPAFLQLEGGSGPRHFGFHANGKLAFVVNELGSTVIALRYDSHAGTLTPIQRISTLPANFPGKSTCADIHVHPNGKFVYASNRGHDSIAIFRIDQETGHLTALGQKPTGGKTPRNFAIDPTGGWLLAANQDSETITIFAIDPNTGQLKPTGRSLTVPKPVCIQFLSRGH